MRFTAHDVVAIQMLSVDVPSATAAWLLSDPGGTLSRHLVAIPANAAVWDDSAADVHSGDGLALWTLLGQHEGLRNTRTTK